MANLKRTPSDRQMYP